MKKQYAFIRIEKKSMKELKDIKERLGLPLILVVRELIRYYKKVK